LRISDEVCCLDGLQKMEPLWSPVVANSGNQSQIGRGRNWRKHAETLSVGFNQLRPGLDGKGRVDATSLFAKEGVVFLAPQREVEPRELEGPQESVRI
jgi:hypothetical protein